MKITLSAVYFNWKSLDGKEYKDKKGNRKCRVVIKGQDLPDKGASAFVYEGSPMLNWKKGDTVDISLEEKNGFTNFVLAGQEKKETSNQELEALVKTVNDLLNRVSALEAGRGANLVAGMRELKAETDILPENKVPF